MLDVSSHAALQGYRALELCGTGATSRVYRAVDSETGRAVALKRLNRHLVRTSQSLARFRRELDALRRVQHPGIAKVHDVIDWDGDPDPGDGLHRRRRPARAGGRERSRSKATWPRGSRASCSTSWRRRTARASCMGSQAAERAHPARWTGGAARLRVGSTGRRVEADHDGHQRRHARVHAAGAVRGVGVRSAGRYLRRGCDVVLRAHRARAAHRREPCRAGDAPQHGGRSARRRGGSGDAGGAGAGHRSVPVARSFTAVLDGFAGHLGAGRSGDRAGVRGAAQPAAAAACTATRRSRRSRRFARSARASIRSGTRPGSATWTS